MVWVILGLREFWGRDIWVGGFKGVRLFGARFFGDGYYWGDGFVGGGNSGGGTFGLGDFRLGVILGEGLLGWVM